MHSHRVRGLRTTEWLARLVAGFMLVAGAIKLADASSFRIALDTWDVIPRAARDLTALALPVAEVAIPLAYFGSVRARPACSWALLGLLGACTLAYVAQWTLVGAPRCGCLGKFLRFSSARSEARVGLARNAVLIGVLIPSLLRPATSRRVETCDLQAITPSHRRGFTLLELLVCIAVIAGLVLLLLPALSRAFDRGRSMSALSKISQHTRIFLSYADDSRDAFPCPLRPSNDQVTVRAGEFEFGVWYFDTVWVWGTLLAGPLYDTDWSSPMFQERATHVPQPMSTFWYSATFLADPLFWNAESRTGPEQWRGTAHHEVLYPSQKVMFLGSRSMLSAQAGGSGRGPFAFVDGSAQELSASAISRGYPHGAGTWPGSSWLVWSLPGLGTIDGVRGRDR